MGCQAVDIGPIIQYLSRAPIEAVSMKHGGVLFVGVPISISPSIPGRVFGQLIFGRFHVSHGRNSCSCDSLKVIGKRQ